LLGRLSSSRRSEFSGAPNAGPDHGVCFVINSAPGRSSREALGGHCDRTLPISPGRGHLVRHTLLPLRQTLGFGCRNRGIAGSHASSRRQIGGNGTVGERMHRGISLNPYQVFPSLAAAVSGNARELIETPLNSQPRSHSDRCLEPYTCTARRLVFHACGDPLGNAIGFFPRGFDEGHDRRTEFEHNRAHVGSIGKRSN
jgi:hypothetical protein